MRYYCSYFDRNYLVRALALIDSLHTHERQPFTFFAVCLDELTRVILTRLALPNVVPLPLHEFEAGDGELCGARSNRDQVEYYWTLTPTVILRLLERNRHIDVLTYLDSDLYFFSSPDPIYNELGADSILIHEHRFHDSFKPAIIYGRFNVGLLSFRNNDDGITALQWWRERCIEWCYNYLEDGRYGDQLYLDSWPERFRGVHILEHAGAGVAPWNNLQYHFEQLQDTTVTVDGLQLVFYHFHGLLFRHPNYVILSKLFSHKFTADIILLCYLPYVKKLFEKIDLLQSVLPEFNFGLSCTYWNAANAAIARNIASIKISDAQGVSHIPETVTLDKELTLLVSEQVING